MADFNLNDYQNQKELLDAIAEQQADPEMLRKAQAELNEWVVTGVRPGDPVSNADSRDKLLADAEEAGVLTDFYHNPGNGETVDVTEALADLDEELTERLYAAKTPEELNTLMAEAGLVRKLRG